MAKGTMSIECSDEGLALRTQLEDVSMWDKLAIVSSVLESLEFEVSEIPMAAMFYAKELREAASRKQGEKEEAENNEREN